MVLGKKLPKFKSLKLSHSSPEVFVLSQWMKAKSFYFLVYRFVFTISFISILTYSITNSVVINKDFGYWFIYLTNNGLFICTVYSFYAAILVTLYTFDCIRFENEGAIAYKLFWLLSNISKNLAFVISIVYWSLLFEWELYFNGKI